MDRERLTITLRDDLLRRLDEFIDGVRIRNRSHAIEYFLSQSLAPKVTQAVILAGGKGVKMRPITYEIPKALISVKGKAVIDYSVELLRESGIREIVIALGHLGEKIRQHVGNGQKYGINVVYSEEHKTQGSAATLRSAQGHLNNKPFIVLNGDVIAQISLSGIVQFHEPEKYVATMALSSVADTSGYGTVLLRGQRIVRFLPKGGRDTTHLVDAGIYMFSPTVFQYIPAKGASDLDNVFEKLAKEGKLAGYTFEGRWFEVTTPKNYERALKSWPSPK